VIFWLFSRESWYLYTIGGYKSEISSTSAYDFQKSKTVANQCCKRVSHFSKMPIGRLISLVKFYKPKIWGYRNPPYPPNKYLRNGILMEICPRPVFDSEALFSHFGPFVLLIWVFVFFWRKFPIPSKIWPPGKSWKIPEIRPPQEIAHFGL